MRIVIIVLVVIALLFVGTMVFGTVSSSDGGGQRPSEQELEDSGFLQSLYGMTSRFAPKVRLSPAVIRLDLDDPETPTVPAGKKDRIVRLRLTQGQFVRVTTNCIGRGCGETGCLCASGQLVREEAAIGCDAEWVARRRAGGRRIRCRAGDETLSLPAYPTGGSLQLVAPLGSATVESR